MSIINRSVESLTPHSGRYKARLLYEFADGRKIRRGPSSVSDQAGADALLISLEQNVALSTQEQDAEHAIESDISESHKTATSKQVKLAWLKKGFIQTEAYRAYFYLKKVMPELMTLNKTDAQLATILDTTVSVVVEIKTKWLALDADSSTLVAYEQIQRAF